MRVAVVVTMIVTAWAAIPLVMMVVVVVVTVVLSVECSGAAGEADVAMRSAMWMGVDVTAVPMRERDVPIHEATR